MADSAALADAAAGNFSASVVHCPDWMVGDLVYHVCRVQYLWRRIVSERLEPDQINHPVRPPDASLIEAFRAGTEQLVAVLGAADPAMPVWTWAPQKDARVRDTASGPGGRRAPLGRRERGRPGGTH